MLTKRRKFIQYIVSGFALASLYKLSNLARFFTPAGFTMTTIVFAKDRSSRRTYGHVEEFWVQFTDPVAKELNQRFLAQGKLVSMHSHLTKSKRAAILTKVYRSQADYIEYRQAWRNASPEGEAELQKVSHRIIDAHLTTSDLRPMDIV